MKKISKIVSSILVSCVLLNSFASATSSMSSNAETDSTSSITGASIDRDTAATIAMIFVADAVIDGENTEVWNTTTNIRDIITMYDLNNSVNAYCVLLSTNDEPSGYVTVAADSAAALIPDFSESSDPAPLSPKNANEPSVCSIDSLEDRVYYVSPVAYTENAPNPQTRSSNAGDALIRSENNVQSNNVILSKIKSVQPINSQDWIDRIDRKSFNSPKSNTSGSWIDNPLTYLKNTYGTNYTNDYYNNDLEGHLPAWNQGNAKTCSIHMLAALCYVNRSSISSTFSNMSLSQIYNKFYNAAVSGGFYNSSSGIDFDRIDGLGNAVLIPLKSSWYCRNHYPLTIWTTCEAEIDAGRAVGINMFLGNGNYYSNHSVAGYAYTVFTNPAKEIKPFIKIRDGYTTASNRYLDCNSVSIASVTTIS